MTRPTAYILRMIAFLALVAGAIVALHPFLRSAFMANVVINGIILSALALGILYILRQAWSLAPAADWIETFRRTGDARKAGPPPALLAQLAPILGSSAGSETLAAPTSQTLLVSVRSRLDEGRENSRYLIGLLIFLGLLGTFWGLLQTIQSVGGVLTGLELQPRSLEQFLANLREGLTAPLDGMGTAFSSSLFGLAGSLVLGFLDLTAGQAQNRFFNNLEEWLSSITRHTLPAGVSAGERPTGFSGEISPPAYLEALMQQTADNLDSLQRTLSRSEAAATESHRSLVTLAERLETLSDQMRAEQKLMLKLAESHADIRPLFVRLTELAEAGKLGLDEASQDHLRHLDVQLTRLVDDQVIGRDRMLADLRSEIRLLARTLGATIRDDAAGPGATPPHSG